MGKGRHVVRDLEDFAGIASDWFWETDADHRFTYFSARMEQVTQIRPETVLGQRRDQLVRPKYSESCSHQHLDDLQNRRPFRDFEYRIKRDHSDNYMWLRVSGNPVFDETGAFIGYRGTGHDVTKEKENIASLAEVNTALEARNRELNKLRRELELAAFEDPLTGLRNRRAFDEQIGTALSWSNANVALLLIDLDRFKWVNDTLGHPAGDMVLVTAAGRLQDLCDAQTEVFRLGGDEFAILGHCDDAQSSNALGQSIIDTIAEPMAFKSRVFNIGASVGIALSGGLPTSPHRLIAKADGALYAAKGAGRGCVRKAVA